MGVWPDPKPRITWGDVWRATAEFFAVLALLAIATAMMFEAIK